MKDHLAARYSLPIEYLARRIALRPREIATQLQIVVWERKMESHYDGCLMKVGDAWGILINSLIQSQSRKNFTIAHELGHYQLDREHPLQHRCQREDLRAFDSHRLEEQRANQFAVELLMPFPIFSDFIGKILMIQKGEF